MDSLATLHARRGQPARAAERYRQALAIFRETGEPDGEASTLNGLGEAAHTTGDPAEAVTHHTAAHTIAVGIGDREQQARAHAGLGRAHHGYGDLSRARHHYRHAVTLYSDLGMPQADEIRTRLAATENG